MYQVLTHTSLVGLIQEVKDAIAQGWVPLGGIAVVFNSVNNTTHHYQAMTKDPA